MTVTEFVLAYLAGGPLTPEVHQVLEECQQIQDGWLFKQKPNTPANRIDRGTGMLQQVEDPSAILITAQWDTPEAHWDWIRTEENKAAMAKLGPLLVAEGEKKLLLFHIDSVIFPQRAEGVSSPLASAVTSVRRYFVKASDKERFSSRFEQAKGLLDKRGFKGGWRIERENCDSDEFLLFNGWASVDEHNQFLASPEFSHLESLADYAKEVDAKLYKRIV
ncbi:hypothetical protein jhhlp_008692 [Lomentospora prolificans]|uniref:ABM domain-containing protein n=1 Tax=Lomentospora prolificans TaxID=41688 RepID=A0A2N3MYR8_9PEZI|nr:hypothetical protein jhhlp_008692 [Lomentospora prolificans]